MTEYQPLDLTTWYNAGHDVLGPNMQAPVGAQLFRGLPFHIGNGDAGGRCYIAPGAGDSITIPIGQTAYRVIVAHRLLDSELMQGCALGKPVAEYVFRVGGEEIRVPIRERFEIGVVPPGWGSLAFRAVPDQQDGMLARYEGAWGDAGRRQTEVNQGVPAGYYLWVWKNPNPERVIDSLTINPRGPRFIIAAITLGCLDEHPFVRGGLRVGGMVLSGPVVGV
jgi:hypothetical protein